MQGRGGGVCFHHIPVRRDETDKRGRLLRSLISQTKGTMSVSVDPSPTASPLQARRDTAASARPDTGTSDWKQG